jgi:DNA-binding FadR family transcriptional regulator
VPEALSRVNRAKLYEQVLERIRAHVEETGLRAGDKLPSERDLAERLGVSRASIKQAIVVLEVQGLLESRHGGGTYLRSDQLDVEPVDELVARRSRLPEVLEAREALETKLAELAAQRRTRTDLAAIDAALERGDRARRTRHRGRSPLPRGGHGGGLQRSAGRVHALDSAPDRGEPQRVAASTGPPAPVTRPAPEDRRRHPGE